MVRDAGRVQFFLHAVGEVHEVAYGELLRAFGKDGVAVAFPFFSHDLAQGVAQGFPPLVESGFYDAFEKCFVAAEVGDVVACHADDGAFHLGWRVEHVFMHGEEVFHVVPSLDKHAEDAICLAAGRGGDAFGHFFLYHAGAAGDEVLVVEHLEEDLAGYVVGVVAGKDERGALEYGAEVELQEVVFDDMFL